MLKKSVLFSLFSLIGILAIGQEPDKGQFDEKARKVQEEILDTKKVEIENLKVLHKDGAIYLEGVAGLYGSRHLAEEKALKVKGVTSVDNQIAVTRGDVSDLDIETQIMAKIRSHLRGTPFDLVSVKVNNGFVLLRGNVRDQTLVKDSFESAIWVRGVRGVENRIDMASVGSGDERLRQGIYNRLSREFQQYFVGRYPSILIIVNSSRVELVGYVDSNVSREKILSIVRSFPGVLSVINNLQTN